MKRKLFNKIFIILITVSIFFSNTVLAGTDTVQGFKEYLLNNFSINIEYEQYILEQDKIFEDEVNLLIEQSITNVTEYSEVKSQELEETLIIYGNSVMETVIKELDEIKNNIYTNSVNESNDITINNDEDNIETTETEIIIEEVDINE